MKKVQQDVICALLQTLLGKELSTQKVQDKSREKILGTWDWPEFFCCAEDDSREEPYGSA